MANIILLVDTDYVKQNSFLIESIEEKYIEISIMNSQRLYIEPVLGTKLYKKLQELIDNNDINATGFTSYKSLLDEYVVPALTYMTMYECILPLTYKVTPKGLIRNSNENSELPSAEEIRYLSGQFSQRGEKYLELLRKYLMDDVYNSNLPEYNSSNLQSSDVAPDTKSQYKTSIYVKRGNRCRYNF
jgi:hypothetical protein